VLERLVRLVRPGRRLTRAERRAARAAAPIETHAPDADADADADDVGVPGPVTGFDGRELRRRQQGSGHGTGDAGGPGWAGWGGMGGQ
jgi:hypothetical protein